MALLIKNNAVFLHIPKTGGMWVENVLYEHALVKRRVSAHRHADFDRVTDYLRSGSGIDALHFAYRRGLNKAVGLFGGTVTTYSARFRFCFVRHPINWYESWYNYMNPRDWHDFGIAGDPECWHPMSGLNGLGSSDFNVFIANVIRTSPGFVSNLYSIYARPGIEYVGKTETLAEDLSAVFDRLGIRHEKDQLLQKPPANVSSTKTNKPEWDPKLRDQVMRLEMPALVKFGYLTEAEKIQYGIDIL